ncbi:MAG TPA: hypothetical protein VKA83_22275 [Methylomirabilota bacterium]|nr:hypothetical protein [Methylomirabilota bacterium]
MTAAPDYHQLIEPCPYCPSRNRCTTERTCRATWDSAVRDDTFAAEREDAERHPCRDCHADTGEPCRNLHTGKPLARQPAHLARIRAAIQPTEEATP